MYVLRCTHRLLRDVEGFHAAAPGRANSTNCLGDWFANRLNIGPQRYVLATSSLCLLSVVVPARDLKKLPARLADAVDRLLDHLEVPHAIRSTEVAAMADARTAVTNSRIVLRSMQDIAVQADGQLYDLPHRPGRQLDHVNVWLAHVPLGPLGYATPGEAALRLLEHCNASPSARRSPGRATSIQDVAALLDR